MKPQSDDGNVPAPATAMGDSLQNDNSIPQSRSSESESKSRSQKLKKLNKDRKRVSKACDNCACRKVKCDGNVPCTPCLLRGRSCEATKIARRRREPSSIQAKCEKLWSSSLPKVNSENHLRSGPDLMPCQPDPSFGQNKTYSTADMARLLGAVHANRSEWDIYFEKFCKNVHPQYPMLDLSTLRSRFKNVSKLLPLSPSFDFASKDYQAEISQVLICLAIGKFCESCYSDGAKGCHTSGWGLYSTAFYLHGDLVTSEQGFSDQLMISQTMILMTIYLCFVDETIRARSLLSIAILQLYSMNCRQSEKIDSESVLKDDNLRRALCCSYVLERELGLEFKDSLIIPDSTVEKFLTIDIGSYWLSPRQRDTENVFAPQSERDEDLATSDSATASHIMAITLHAQATGRIWRELHHDTASKSGIDHFLVERLEISVEEAHKIVEAQQKKMKNGNSSLESKEEVLMQIKWCYLRLLLSRSILRKPHESQNLGDQDIERTKLTCIDLVYTILRALGELANEYPKFTFPYLHIHITAVELGLELMMGDSLLRECYGSTVLQELDSLSQCCFRTSTPARITRKILSIKQTARTVCSTVIDPGIAGERKHFMPQVLEHPQSLPWKPVSPEIPFIHQGGDEKMLLHEHLSSSTHDSSPEDMLSIKTPLSSNQSITCGSLDAAPGMPTQFDVADECDSCQKDDIVIKGSKSSLDYPQTDFSTTFNYGVSEFGLDPAALFALSHAGISPFQDF